MVGKFGLSISISICIWFVFVFVLVFVFVGSGGGQAIPHKGASPAWSYAKWFWAVLVSGDIVGIGR